MDAVMPGTWKAVTLGTYLNCSDYRAALRKEHVFIGPTAEAMFSHLEEKSCPGKRKAELVRVSLCTLGFSERVPYETVCKRASESGLSLCERETALALRLSYKNQPPGEYLLIATEPVPLRARFRAVYWLDHADDVFSIRGFGVPGCMSNPAQEIVFSKPQ